MRVTVSFECEVESSEKIEEIQGIIDENLPYGKTCSVEIQSCTVMNREVSHPALRNMIESDVSDIAAFEYWEEKLEEYSSKDSVLETAIVALVDRDRGVRDAFEMMVTDKSHMVILLDNDEKIFKLGDKEYRIIKRGKEE